MPLDGFTLGFVCDEVALAIVGGRIERVQQPDKSSIILIIRNNGENHRFLLAANPNASRFQLTELTASNPAEPPMFCMLLRRRLSGARVLSLSQVGGDRVFNLDMEAKDEFGETAQVRLVIEATGRNCNLVFVDASNRIIDAIRHVNSQMSRAREILPGRMYLPPPRLRMQEKDERYRLNPRDFVAEDVCLPISGKLSRAIVGIFDGVGQVTANELSYRATGDADARIESFGADIAARRVCEVIGDLLEHLEPTALLEFDSSSVSTVALVKDIFPFHYASLSDEFQRSSVSLSVALDECYASRDEYDRVRRMTQSIAKTLDTLIEREERKRAVHLEALAQNDEIARLTHIGELIIANIYRIPKGAAAVTLEDFDAYATPVSVSLDKLSMPSENAQRYFKKARKLRAARDQASEQLRLIDEKLTFLYAQRQDVESCSGESDLREIRQELVREGLVKPETKHKNTKKTPTSKPSRYVSSDGAEIVLGRTSIQNDRVTSSADGNDTWLHAKDMPGSHVIVRSGAPSDATLADALQLAAWHSKGQGSSNVPIDVTLRKYVKKPSGAPAGFVIYTHQKTYAVTPRKEKVEAITKTE
ncbi:fibronectin-binding protein A [Clostridia bacterium]|nr:fibronectin-binding protein A [Clostridia bacterium]